MKRKQSAVGKAKKRGSRPEKPTRTPSPADIKRRSHSPTSRALMRLRALRLDVTGAMLFRLNAADQLEGIDLKQKDWGSAFRSNLMARMQSVVNLCIKDVACIKPGPHHDPQEVLKSRHYLRRTLIQVWNLSLALCQEGPVTDRLTARIEQIRIRLDEAIERLEELILPDLSDPGGEPADDLTDTERRIVQAVRELGPGLVKKKDIAEHLGYKSPSSLDKPLAALARRGVLKSHTGRHGGYWIP